MDARVIARMAAEAQRQIAERPEFTGGLKVGDARQIAILRLMNGPDAYCPRCLRKHGMGDVGQLCDRRGCGGIVVPGAALEAELLSA